MTVSKTYIHGLEEVRLKYRHGQPHDVTFDLGEGVEITLFLYGADRLAQFQQALRDLANQMPDPLVSVSNSEAGQ